MALRLATVIAIGRGHDHIRIEDLEYGIKLAKQSGEYLEEGATDYMAENENQANAQKIIRILKAHRGRVKYRDLVRSLQNSIRSRDLKELLHSMHETGPLEKRGTKSQRGRLSIWYKIQK